MKYHKLGNSSIRSLRSVLLIFFVSIFCFAMFLTFDHWEGQSPSLKFDRNFTSLGRQSNLIATVTDEGAGLKQVVIDLKLRNKMINLVNKQYSSPPIFYKTTEKNSSESFDLGKITNTFNQIREGPASIIVSAKDFSFRGLFGGNKIVIKKDFTFDFSPPKLEVLSGQHYIRQGGSECILYRVEKDTHVSGVKVGPHFFPGYSPQLSDKQIRFSIFAYHYDLPLNSKMTLVARDKAGNESRTMFRIKFFPKKFRHRRIHLDKQFLKKIIPKLTNKNPELLEEKDLIKEFVQVNNELRDLNHQTIKKISKRSSERILWTEPFSQLSQSKVESFFADHRTYFYKGVRIDHQDHVGFDLASVKHYPIEASNNGIIRYATNLGIYGKTVLIDHGCGLFSLYGHLSSISVEQEQKVNKGDIIGLSGTTGLAAGDHLHFGLFLQGIPVNPVEWWDRQWIQEHLWERINAIEKINRVGS